MKLTSKVGIAFAILCGLMAMGTAISFFSLGRINSAFTFVVQDLSSLADQGSAIGKGLLRSNKLANDMVLNDTVSGLEQGRSQFTEQAQSLKKALNGRSKVPVVYVVKFYEMQPKFGCIALI